MPAATDFHVNGPTTVRWGLNTGALIDLGFTDNDDLVRIAVTDHKRIFTRNDSGDMIAEVVYSGSTAVIDVTFVSINEDELNELVSKARTGAGATAIANQGVFATVGGVTIGNAAPATGVRIFSLEIEPTNAGETMLAYADASMGKRQKGRLDIEDKKYVNEKFFNIRDTDKNLYNAIIALLNGILLSRRIVLIVLS